MIIYKITNKINNKVYVGQTITTLKQRWQRHCNDAINGQSKLKFARAIRKYGRDNFIVEEIDYATTKQELDEKEKYWIKYYNSIKNGYNLVDGGSDSNSYKYKTTQEMSNIKEKIRQTKLGKNNPHSKKVKCKNINTKQELHFDTLKECQIYFNETNHQFISRRILGKIKYVFKNEWIFAYEYDEYPTDFTLYPVGRQQKISIKILETNEVKIFCSKSEAERYFHLPDGTMRHAQKNQNTYVVRNMYEITVLKQTCIDYP